MDAQHNALSEQLTDLQDAVDANTAALALLPAVSRSVPSATAGMLRARNTVVFNAATTGSVGTHVVFTLTGRVFVDLITAFCSQTLTQGGATPTMTLGTANDVDAFIASPTGGPTDLVTGDWWTQATTSAGSVGPLSVVTGDRVTAQRFKLLSENIVLIIGAQTITGGTLVYDVWYYPITDDGLLVATVN